MSSWIGKPGCDLVQGGLVFLDRTEKLVMRQWSDNVHEATQTDNRFATATDESDPTTSGG
jgi:hypothetical protein